MLAASLQRQYDIAFEIIRVHFHGDVWLLLFTEKASISSTAKMALLGLPRVCACVVLAMCATATGGDPRGLSDSKAAGHASSAAVASLLDIAQEAALISCSSPISLICNALVAEGSRIAGVHANQLTSDCDSSLALSANSSHSADDFMASLLGILLHIRSNGKNGGQEPALISISVRITAAISSVGIALRTPRASSVMSALARLERPAPPVQKSGGWFSDIWAGLSAVSRYSSYVEQARDTSGRSGYRFGQLLKATTSVVEPSAAGRGDHDAVPDAEETSSFTYASAVLESVGEWLGYDMKHNSNPKASIDSMLGPIEDFHLLVSLIRVLPDAYAGLSTCKSSIATGGNQLMISLAQSLHADTDLDLEECRARSKVADDLSAAARGLASFNQRLDALRARLDQFNTLPGWLHRAMIADLGECDADFAFGMAASFHAASHIGGSGARDAPPDLEQVNANPAHLRFVVRNSSSSVVGLLRDGIRRLENVTSADWDGGNHVLEGLILNNAGDDTKAAEDAAAYLLERLIDGMNTRSAADFFNLTQATTEQDLRSFITRLEGASVTRRIKAGLHDIFNLYNSSMSLLLGSSPFPSTSASAAPDVAAMALAVGNILLDSSYSLAPLVWREYTCEVDEGGSSSTGRTGHTNFGVKQDQPPIHSDPFITLLREAAKAFFHIHSIEKEGRKAIGIISTSMRRVENPHAADYDREHSAAEAGIGTDGSINVAHLNDAGPGVVRPSWLQTFSSTWHQLAPYTHALAMPIVDAAMDLAAQVKV